MGRKPKFRPKITRVKLNPEQAVLSCNCWSTGRVFQSQSHVAWRYWVGTSPELGRICGYDQHGTKVLNGYGPAKILPSWNPLPNLTAS